MATDLPVCPQPRREPASITSSPRPATERAEIGRFQFTRRGRLIWLEIAIDGRCYKVLLHTWS